MILNISIIELIVLSSITIFLYMTLWFILSLIYKRNDIADIAWGLGFIVVVGTIYLKYFSSNPFQNINYLIVLILTTLWGSRLALHIYARNKLKTEDYRYKKWREDWGKTFYIRSYLQVYLLQGFLMLLISMYAIVLASTNSPVTIYTYLGIFIWFIGFLFESLGDLELSKFLANPLNKDKIMQSGLWRYTRHPNYFGEVTQWWGIYIITFSLSYMTLAIISPLVISFLILKVSGIPMLEKRYEDNKDFQRYKRVTNAFFPWFPREAN